jgi:hypothetical protein
MIRHIVLFKLREYDSPEKKQQAAEAVAGALMKLKSKIPVIASLEVGINEGKNPAAWDVALNTAFRSTNDLEVYQVHPDHQAFIAFNKDYSVQKAIIDFEIP